MGKFRLQRSFDQFLFRTAEAYLNAAGRAYMGEEGTARTLLKALRDKRLINSTMPTESGESLVTLIREERQCELCLEGHRWYDLRRYLVCEKYPYSKTITHYYTTLITTVRCTRNVTCLKPMIRTLALPKEVLDFQNNLGTNHRPTRTSTDYTPEEPDDVTPPVQE
ncbi:MAG: RagB/SusD family nutrient uptake outer membrane protein [Butyricimonas faecihominis]